MLGRDAAAGVGNAHPRLLSSNTRRNGDRSAGVDRVAGIHQQVQKHLIEPRRQALNLRQVAVAASDARLVLDFVPHDVERAVEASVQIDDLPRFVGTAARKVAQILHDALDPHQPVARFGEQRHDVAAQEIEVLGRAERARRCECRRQRRQRPLAFDVAIQQLANLLDIRLERREIRENEGDRVVDLVRDARGNLSDRCELLRLDHLVLRVLERCVHPLHRGVQRRQLDDAGVALDVHLMVGDDERQETRERLALIKIADGVTRAVGRAVHRERADRPILHAQRPAHRRMRRAVACLIRTHRQTGFRRIAVDQHRRAGRDDVAEYADAARQCAADHAVGEIGAGDELELIFTALDISAIEPLSASSPRTMCSRISC